MFDFEYHNPTRIVFGKDRLDTLERLVPADARVLVTYGGGSAVRSGLIGRVRAALGARFVREFGGIEPNPQYDTLMKAVDAVRADAIDFLLAVGGGSVIDGTKFVALAAHFDGDPATLPARQVANGIVDAFVHTTEQYLGIGTFIPQIRPPSEYSCPCPRRPRRPARTPRPTDASRPSRPSFHRRAVRRPGR